MKKLFKDFSETFHFGGYVVLMPVYIIVSLIHKPIHWVMIKLEAYLNNVSHLIK